MNDIDKKISNLRRSISGYRKNIIDDQIKLNSLNEDDLRYNELKLHIKYMEERIRVKKTIISELRDKKYNDM